MLLGFECDELSIRGDEIESVGEDYTLDGLGELTLCDGLPVREYLRNGHIDTTRSPQIQQNLSVDSLLLFLQGGLTDTTPVTVYIPRASSRQDGSIRSIASHDVKIRLIVE